MKFARSISRVGVALVIVPQLIFANIPEPQIQSTPNHLVTMDAISSLPKPIFPKIWQVYAAPGLIVDNNINHLLIDSTINSNIRLADVASFINAGAILKPDWGSTFVPYFNYDFQRFDYEKFNNFSYYSHRVYGSLNTWFIRHLAWDTGMEGMWYADDTGLVVDTQNLHNGLRWELGKWRGRAGYAYQRDAFQVDTGETSHSNIGYAELSRGIWGRHGIFADYSYRANAAQDQIFSYRSHYAEAGIVSAWTSKFRTVFMGTYLAKPYADFDDRFGALRQDHTVGAIIKPSYALYPNLRLIGAFTYLHNNSNVEVKRYYDQIYSVFLEARL